MKKILVPCDFSEPSQEAFKFAVDLAAHVGSSVTVLKVIDLPILAYGASIDMPIYNFSPSLIKELEEDAKISFEKMNQKLGKSSVNIVFSTVSGPTFPMIQDFIDEGKFDLVIMGTHGATGLAEFFVGSNTEKIVRFSKAPVIAIRKAIPLSAIKNIVLPTYLQYYQDDFIKEVKSLQKIFNAKLHILYLNTPSSFISDDELKKYADHYRFENYSLAIRHNRNEPDGIISYAEEIKADMLAMATHGRKGLAHFIRGSITEDVVNHVQLPIWTYRMKQS
jgi:nucleotide-binding universal stress UspA family protein